MKAAISLNQFEEIILHPDKYSEWNNIFRHHIDVEIDLSKEEILGLESDVNSVLFHFINSTGGKFCNAFNRQFIVDESPSIIYFNENLDLKNNGFLPINNNLDVPFKLSYAKSLEKNSEINFQSYKGWKALFLNKNLPSNSLIINDSYIFDDKENNTSIGSKNLTELLDAILPDELNIPYHILINTSTSKNKTSSFYDEFIPQLIDDIIALRSYEIIVEVVIGEGFHKRKLFTNFLNVTTDKGFKIFDKRDHSKVLDHNDIIIETMFTRNDPTQGDSQFDEMKVRLKELRKLIKNALDWINAETYNKTRSFYYSNLEQEKQIEIKNRLYHAKK
ncbi:hypothetical protein OBK19_12360 [Empedobacter falsenii]|uniref:Uncharacterized protein n=1 Tax=Empedobacter falsenii TaxID=343874 RepID=A0ABY8VD62_9FLAO|nr:hypothetical protein [Empedobacter falsenii]WIH98213.1 hypothetical protein OBA43_04595 [Empedobacter falsenii]